MKSKSTADDLKEHLQSVNSSKNISVKKKKKKSSSHISILTNILECKSTFLVKNKSVLELTELATDHTQCVHTQYVILHEGEEERDSLSLSFPLQSK